MERRNFFKVIGVVAFGTMLPTLCIAKPPEILYMKISTKESIEYVKFDFDIREHIFEKVAEYKFHIKEQYNVDVTYEFSTTGFDVAEEYGYMDLNKYKIKGYK